MDILKRQKKLCARRCASVLYGKVFTSENCFDIFDLIADSPEPDVNNEYIDDWILANCPNVSYNKIIELLNNI